MRLARDRATVAGMQNKVDEGGKTLGQVAEAAFYSEAARPINGTGRTNWDVVANAVKGQIVAWLRQIGASGAASELERSAGIPWEPPKPPPPPPG